MCAASLKHLMTTETDVRTLSTPSGFDSHCDAEFFQLPRGKDCRSSRFHRSCEIFRMVRARFQDRRIVVSPTSVGQEQPAVWENMQRIFQSKLRTGAAPPESAPAGRKIAYVHKLLRH